MMTRIKRRAAPKALQLAPLAMLAAAMAGIIATAANAQRMPSTPDLGKAEGRCRANEPGPAVIVEVVGLKDRQGLLKLELYPANDTDFLAPDNVLISDGKVFRRVEEPTPAEGPVSLCIRVPGPGTYSLMLLHDRDGNHKFSLWADGVGFPGNPKLGWGKPRAAQTRLTAGAGITHTTIVLNYRHGLGMAPIKSRFVIATRMTPRARLSNASASYEYSGMRIVDVCAFYSPHGGGVKTYVEQKLAIGPEFGHEIIILAPGDKNEVIERGDGAKIVTIACPRFPLDRRYWYFNDEPMLHAALEALQPDFIEASSPWRSAAMVARWPGAAPRVLVMHADPLSAYAYRWFGPIFSRATIDRRFGAFWRHLRELGQRFDRVICASRELEGRLAAGGVANTALHPMGIEEGVFGPDRRSPELRQRLLALCDLPESARLLIGVGRLAAEKRWPMVVDAVTAASQTLPIGLVIVGQGGQRHRILRHIAGNPHIRLIGSERDRNAFAMLLASADALIHGCEAETFCMAAAEARASGVPVIVPDCGGAADHARDGAGITYRAGSALAAAHACVKLLRSPPPARAGTVVTMRGHFAALFADYARITRRERQVA